MQIDPPHDQNRKVFLAPMAGITDLPFRGLVSRFGAVQVVSEMIASQDILTGRPGTRARAELGLGVENTAVQLAGRDPYWMSEAAKFCEAGGAQIIDINMGCPAKKVTSGSGLGAAGSALMREPDLALRLIEAVVSAVSVPVTLKTRLGWDESSLTAPCLAASAESAGVTMITIHGRTRCQFYKGVADWSAIARVSAAVKIPVIANGDISNPSDARRALAASNAQGVMIGRAARGQPWLPACIEAALNGRSLPDIPCGADLLSLVQEHYETMLYFYGSDLGPRVARKHLSWYMDHASTPGALRQELLTETRPDVVLKGLTGAFDEALAGDIAA
ncbi:MAG: tRNA dihydrouridine synthase DusB [Pseudomonadota bacterium]